MYTKKLTRREKYAIKNYLESLKPKKKLVEYSGPCENIKPPKDFSVCTEGPVNRIGVIGLGEAASGKILARLFLNHLQNAKKINALQ